MFFVFGFTLFFAGVGYFYHYLALELFKVDLGTFLLEWWSYDEFRYLLIFINLLVLVAGLLYGSLWANFQIFLFGKSRAFMLLGKGLEEKVYLSSLENPKEVIELECFNDKIGAANLNTVYRRYIVTRYGKAHYGPQLFYFSKQIGLIIAITLLLFFPFFLNTLPFKSYAIHEKMWERYELVSGSNIEGVLSLIMDQASYIVLLAAIALFFSFVVILLLFWLLRPRGLFADDQILSFPAKIKPGFRTAGRPVERKERYAKPQPGSNSSKKQRFMGNDYVLKLEKDFDPPIFIHYSVDEHEKAQLKSLDQAFDRKTEVTVIIDCPDAREGTSLYEAGPVLLQVQH
ncbi:MAG: hypothetical protein MI743_12330 [Sneathiellales bacterium]|nr:hypothetical protein [Sneathiellales bacterium]